MNEPRPKNGGASRELPFYKEVVSGGFSSFSNRINTFTSGLVHLAQELEQRLYFLDKPKYQNDDEAIEFRDRMRDLLNRVVLSAKGEG